MNALIKINPFKFNHAEVNSVNARDLWAFLDSRQEFSHWIKARIDKYAFVEGVDYVAVDTSINGAPARQYIVTISMAKELAMVERTAKGKQARLYFIECERVALAKTPLTFEERVTAILLEASEKVKALTHENTDLKQKLLEAEPAIRRGEAFDADTNTALYSVKDVSRMLRVPEKRLREFLVTEKLLFKKGGRYYGYATHRALGYCTSHVPHVPGNEHFPAALFTGKGVRVIQDRLWVAVEKARAEREEDWLGIWGFLGDKN